MNPSKATARRSPSVFRWASLILAISEVLPSAASANVAIDVRGRSRLVASAECDANGVRCTVRGTLHDDLGIAIPNQTVQLVLENGATPLSRAGSFEECSGEPDGQTRVSGPASLGNTVTKASGEFCVRITSSEPLTGALRLDYAGGARVDADSTRIELVAGRRATDIDWLNLRRRLEIDAANTILEIRLTSATQPATEQRVSIAVMDGRSEREVLRASESTDSSGIARFRVQGEQLGAVGAARLVASFDGDAKLASSNRSWPVLRVCNVRLEPKRFDPKVTLGESTDLSVLAQTRCGPVPSGIVEFSVQGQLVGRAPVIRSEATWQFSTARYRSGPITVLAKYVPPADGWIPNAGARFDVLVAPPSARATIFWLIASTGLGVWLAVKWGRGAIQPLLRRESERRSEAVVSIDCTPPEPGKTGWYGVVLDAHTGSPISNARLLIEHPGFAERQIAASTTSSQHGEFVLPVLDPQDLARLRVEARHYTEGQWPLPPQGRLTIRLQTTRRALLHAFVAWFESSNTKGAPRAEPTPAEVRLRTTHEQSAAVVEWATSIEKAAFGPTDPDADAKSLLSGPSQAPKLRKDV